MAGLLGIGLLAASSAANALPQTVTPCANGVSGAFDCDGTPEWAVTSNRCALRWME